MNPTIKEIKYTGYAAQPSDYDCPDDQLTLSLNLLNEDGASIHAIRQPKKLHTLPEGFRAVFRHDAGGKRMLIVSHRSDATDSALLFSTDSTKTDLEFGDFRIIDSFGGRLLSVTAVGNTLVAVTSEGLRYCLYRDGLYTALGPRPPFISISMGMYRAGILTDADTCEYSDCPAWTVENLTLSSGNPRPGSPRHWKTPEDTAAMRAFSTSVMGLLLSSVAEKVTPNGLFWQPCFVRYAYRLFDGSYAWHSAPVLMLPNVCPPLVKPTPSFSEGKLTVTSQLQVPYFALSRRILPDGIEALEPWADVIAAIDVFVSPPLYTFRQDEEVDGYTDRASLYLRSRYIRTRSEDPVPDGNHRHPLKGIDPSPEYAFTGHFSEGISQSAADHTVSLADEYAKSPVWNIAPSEKFEDAIADCCSFYLYASIPFADIKADSSPVRVEPDVKDLSNLPARPTLPDDYQSHFRLLPSRAVAYNSRLHLCGMRLGLPEPFPAASAFPASGSDDEQEEVTVRVWSRRNGVCCSTVPVLHCPASLFPLSKELPRWFFYPDSSAYAVRLTSGELSVVLPLTPHPTLNGAYWYGGIAAEPRAGEFSPLSIPDYVPDSAPVLSKVYVSEATNPFTFPPASVVTVGAGEVFALSSAAKALSQGQFGQFPLYAFTSEGVWALEVNASGAYSARQPITRDVALSPDSICQIDSAVLFLSERGVMLLSGSSAECVSEALSDDGDPFTAASLPGQQALFDYGIPVDVPASFSRFLADDARMLYDYPRQRIILFSPRWLYAYVWSLRSKQWGMMQTCLEYGVPSYPEALAVDSAGRLVDASQDADQNDPDSPPLEGVLLTRPIGLGIPDILKSVLEVHQRGFFPPGSVRTVLYGSRDLRNWHVVASSKTHRVMNLRGTPWRRFRLLLVCRLAPGESLSATAFRFLPRLPRRLG